jgi:hypothetical protein
MHNRGPEDSSYADGRGDLDPQRSDYAQDGCLDLHRRGVHGLSGRARAGLDRQWWNFR